MLEPNNPNLNKYNFALLSQIMIRGETDNFELLKASEKSTPST